MGWGIVSVRGNRLAAAGWGVIRQSSDRPMVERLVHIHEELDAVLRTWKPDSAAVEGIFQSGPTKNVQSALKLAHARGVALLAVARAGIAVAEYAPAEVKKSLTGHGRAEKGQVMEMVRAILGMTGPVPEDAADALAVATCHAFRIQNPLLGGLTR